MRLRAQDFSSWFNTERGGDGAYDTFMSNFALTRGVDYLQRRIVMDSNMFVNCGLQHIKKCLDRGSNAAANDEKWPAIDETTVLVHGTNMYHTDQDVDEETALAGNWEKMRELVANSEKGVAQTLCDTQNPHRPSTPCPHMYRQSGDHCDQICSGGQHRRTSASL